MSRKCLECGQAAGTEDIYCTSCGKRLEKNVEVVQSVNTGPASIEYSSNAPLTLGDCMLIGLILLIPIVNVIVFLIWALDKGENINRKNLAKAGLIYLLIGFILSAILGVGIVRAVMLDQENYPEYYYFDYETEMPSYDKFTPLPYNADEI